MPAKQIFRDGRIVRRRLGRHLCCRPLKYCWCWTGLDHPNLPPATAGLDKYVKAWTSAECERARTICCDRIGSYRSAGPDNRAIYADRSEWTGQCAVSIEIDAFNNGFRYHNAPGDVEPLRGEQIRAAQRLLAATLASVVSPSPRGAGQADRHCYGDEADEATRHA